MITTAVLATALKDQLPQWLAIALYGTVLVPLALSIWVTMRGARMLKDPARRNQGWIAIIVTWCICFIGWVPGLLLTMWRPPTPQEPTDVE